MTFTVFAALAALQVGQGVPQYELVAERRYGSSDGPLSFSSVGDIALSGGTLFVTQPDVGEVAIISLADGTLIRSTRSGEGPGEFRTPTATGLRGDTIWVQDWKLGRIGLFNRQGRFLSAIPFPNRHNVLGMTADGAILAHADPQDLRPGLVALTRFSRTGSRTDTLLRVEQSRPRMLEANAPNGPSIRFLNPFAQAPLARMDADGVGSVVVTMDGPPGREIEVTRLLHGQRSTVGVRYPSRKVTKEEADRVTKGFPPPLRTPDAIRRMNFPSAWIDINRMLVARNGDVWLGAADRGEPIRWTVVNRSGQITGTVQSPAGGFLYRVVGNEVWGSELDDEDVPYVVKYSLKRKT